MLSLTNLPSPEVRRHSLCLGFELGHWLTKLQLFGVCFCQKGAGWSALGSAPAQGYKRLGREDGRTRSFHAAQSFLLPAKIRLLQLQTALVSHQSQYDGNTDGLSGWGQPVGIPCLGFAECLARAYAVFSKLYCQCVCAGNCSSSLKVLFFISKTEVYQK